MSRPGFRAHEERLSHKPSKVNGRSPRLPICLDFGHTRTCAAHDFLLVGQPQDVCRAQRTKGGRMVAESGQPRGIAPTRLGRCQDPRDVDLRTAARRKNRTCQAAGFRTPVVDPGVWPVYPIRGGFSQNLGKTPNAFRISSAAGCFFGFFAWITTGITYIVYRVTCTRD
jgi:hypothetical protein